MRERDRIVARRKLDKEMRPLRVLAKTPNQTPGLLRAVRQALGVRAGEMAKRLGVNRSVLFRLERSELAWTISLDSMNRVAKAMGCQLVYGIVPQRGATLEELAGYETVNSLMETAKAYKQWTPRQDAQVTNLSTSRLIELTKRFAGLGKWEGQGIGKREQGTGSREQGVVD